MKNTTEKERGRGKTNLEDTKVKNEDAFWSYRMCVCEREMRTLTKR